jgi:hypothetical protein
VALFVSIGGWMTDYGFLMFIGLLTAGHAAHPQCSADKSRGEVEVGSATRG